MVDPDGDKESIVTRLRGSQRTLIAVVAMVILVGAAGLAVAQTGMIIEDFEDGTTGIFASGAGHVISDNAIEGEYSYRATGSTQTGTFSQATDHFSFYFRVDEPIPDYYDINFDDSNGVSSHRLVFHSDGWAYDGDRPGSTGASQSIFQYDIGTEYYFDYDLTNDSLQVYNATDWSVVYDGDSLTSAGSGNGNIAAIDGPSFGSESDSTWDYIRGGNVPLPGGPTISGTVTDDNNQPIENATVTAELQGSSYSISAETDLNGNYDVAVNNGTYNVTASKDGYFPDEATVEVQGQPVTQDFQLRNQSAALSINTRAFLEHGQSAPYSVTYESQNGTDARLTREDVTDDSTVTSGDTSVVTVDQDEEEIVATDDTSVNNRTYIEAEYSTDGETYTTQRNVTVANATVENLDILPPVTRFSASISNTNIQVIIIAAAAGAAASLIATSFAGVAAMTMVVMLGWIAGFVGDGMAMVTIFIALFVGLNLSAQIDYTVRR